MEIDTLLEALKDFEKKGKEVSPLLEQFLCHVAKTGETLVSWSQFKSYFIFKLEKVMDDFRESAPEQRGPPNPNVECIPFDEMKARIMKIVNGYTGIPFTIQRLCELLIEPKRNYTGTEKFLRGVEKNVMVVSCVHPTSEKNGCSGVKVNGVLLPGNSSAFAERKVNGPGTPRPLNRQKVLLSSSLATNGLPDSTENKDPNTAGAHGKSHSESSVSGPSRLARNKHSVKDEDEGLEEEEQPEVKRLKFLKDGEDGAEDDDEEEEDEEEEDADETAAVETLRPTLAESSSDALQARAHSSASPEKQRDEELEDEEEEEDSVPASSTADCQDQEPSSTQTELCAEESKAGEKEAEREAKAEREVPSSAADDSNAEEPADMDQSEQRAPSGVAGSPESREAGEESNEHVSSSSSSSSSSCSEENEESAATSATPSDSTTEPPAEGTLESGAQDSAAADEPMEVD